MVRIYDNQRECGDQIVEAMFDRDHHYVLLLAQMQMGKSGTYWRVILEALSKGVIEHVYIISGNRERELYHQVQEDALESGEEWGDKIKIIWGSHLSQKQVRVPSDTLIVWDEAHYAQSLKNAPFKFFKHNQLEGLLNGTGCDRARTDNIRLLTVSATPFSELHSKSEEGLLNHFVVRLPTPPTYFGVDYYLRENRIQPSFEINETQIEKLTELIARYSATASYMVIRVLDTQKRARLVRKVCKSIGVRCETINCKLRTMEVSDLARKPERPTVVLISGMLRMGKVMPKEHVSMVFEEKTPKNSRHSDTGLQGLLGRVCGHSENGFDIDVYVEEAMMEYAKDYIDSYDSVNGPLCKPAMNIRKGRPSNKSQTHCQPLEDPPKKAVRSEILKSVLEAFPEMQGYRMVIKNLLAKSNEAHYETLQTGKYTSNVPPETCLIYKRYEGEDRSIWVVTREIDFEEEPVQELDLINDKCVFKKPI